VLAAQGSKAMTAETVVVQQRNDYEETKMINREKRDLARCLIEKFLACQITNDDFVNAYPCREKKDRVIVAIYDRLWGFWDDRHTHALTGKHDLDPEARKLFERCIAFLNSDLEYEWPPLEWRSLSQAFLRLIGLRRVQDGTQGTDTSQSLTMGTVPFQFVPFLAATPDSTPLDATWEGSMSTRALLSPP
jgi:hypothetical protein